MVAGIAGGGEEEDGQGGALPGPHQGKRGPLGGGDLPPPLSFTSLYSIFEVLDTVFPKSVVE